MGSDKETAFTPTRIAEIVRSLDATAGFDKRIKARLVKAAYADIEKDIENGLSFKTISAELNRNGIPLSASYLNNCVRRIRIAQAKPESRKPPQKPAAVPQQVSTAKEVAVEVEGSSPRRAAKQRRDELGMKYVPDAGTVADNPLLKSIKKE
jgi:hypothetical protein